MSESAASGHPRAVAFEAMLHPKPKPRWDPPPANHYCPHGYCWPWAAHPAAGLETCPEGCDTYRGASL